MAAADHVADCGSCRQRLQNAPETANALTSLNEGLASAMTTEVHLDFEEIEDYIEGRADPLTRDMIELHIQSCAACAEHIRELRAFRAMLTTYPQVPVAAAVPPTWIQQALAWMRIPTARMMVMTLAGSAVTGMLVFVVYRGNARMYRQEWEQTREELKRSVARTDALTAEVERTRQQNAQAARQIVEAARRTEQIEKNNRLLAANLDRLRQEKGMQKAPGNRANLQVSPPDSALLAMQLPDPNRIVLQLPKGLETHGRTLAGGDDSKSPFALLEPLHNVISTTRPLFVWQKLEKATGYTVLVKDGDDNVVDQTTEPITQTRWQATKPLARGQTYSWTVTAIFPDKQGDPITVPNRREPEARFEVLSAEKAAQLAPQYYLLGARLAENGLFADAERALSLAEAMAPNTPTAHKARALLKRMHAVSRPTPVTP